MLHNDNFSQIEEEERKTEEVEEKKEKKKKRRLRRRRKAREQGRGEVKGWMFTLAWNTIGWSAQYLKEEVTVKFDP